MHFCWFDFMWRDFYLCLWYHLKIFHWIFHLSLTSPCSMQRFKIFETKWLFISAFWALSHFPSSGLYTNSFFSPIFYVLSLNIEIFDPLRIYFGMKYEGKRLICNFIMDLTPISIIGLLCRIFWCSCMFYFSHEL